MSSIKFRDGVIPLNAEEHAAFVYYLWLSQKPDNMECLQFCFRGHADAVAYLKKNQSDLILTARNELDRFT